MSTINGRSALPTLCPRNLAGPDDLYMYERLGYIHWIKLSGQEFRSPSPVRILEFAKLVCANVCQGVEKKSNAPSFCEFCLLPFFFIDLLYRLSLVVLHQKLIPAEIK
jgi:hypothetical protein